MCRDRRDVSLGAPNVKCVDENYVAHEVMIRTVLCPLLTRASKTVAFEFVDSR